MPVAAVLAIGAVVSAVGAKKASRAQTNAGNAAIAEQQRQFEQTQQTQQPYLKEGTAALGRLGNPQESFQASPSYGFVRGEGQRGIENSFAARGGAQSGNALKALAEFNSGLASQEYGNWWNQQAGLAGAGQSSANVLGAYGTNKANNVSNINIGIGDARASGIAGQYNSLLNAGDQYLGIKESGAFKKKPNQAPYGTVYGGNPWAPGSGVRKPVKSKSYWG